MADVAPGNKLIASEGGGAAGTAVTNNCHPSSCGRGLETNLLQYG